MALICAVPTYADVAAVVGQDVVVINGGHGAVRLRLDKVAPIFASSALYFRAVLSGGPDAPLREGTHLTRLGDFLVRLRLTPLTAEDGPATYQALAEAHLDEIEAARDDLASVAS